LINVAELKEILTAADIADAKVVIFSIVGETRAGKSTLLNIIYRYLACHVQYFLLYAGAL
jgi:ABC-type lipoprotein export system ATPase subunit